VPLGSVSTPHFKASERVSNIARRLYWRSDPRPIARIWHWNYEFAFASRRDSLRILLQDPSGPHKLFLASVFGIVSADTKEQIWCVFNQTLPIEKQNLLPNHSSAIYELIRDGAFPKWANLPKIASGWLRLDIERWIESRTRHHEGEVINEVTAASVGSNHGRDSEF
jgi:predicted DNA-binding transcriptional regulator AlpA